MPKLLKIMLFLCFVFVAPFQAQAQEAENSQRLYQRVDAGTVGRILQKIGIPYQSKFDEFGRPRLVITSRQIPTEQFEIYFFGCNSFGECDSFTMWSWFKPRVPITHYWVNQFNARARWGRGYLNSDDNPVFELDINITGGVTTAYMESMIRAYMTNLNHYARHVKVIN